MTLPVLARRLVGLMLLGSSPAFAQSRLEDGRAFPLRLDLFFERGAWLAVVIVAVLTLAAWLWQRARGGRHLIPGAEVLGASPEHRAAVYGLVPAILAVHVAVPLFVAGVQGQYLSSQQAFGFGWASLIGLVEVGVALAFFYGGFARVAAVVLGVAWLLGGFIIGWTPALENVHLLGFAAFFFLAGRGPIAMDRLLFPKLEPSDDLMRLAVPVLRVFVGLNLVILALTEKLANLPFALAFLEKYPLNFTAAVGLPLSNETFIICSGAVELLAGTWIMLGVFTREIILLAWLPFNLTLTVFNWTELVRLLPVYGALAVFLVWEPGRANLERWVSGLRYGPLAIDRPNSLIREGRRQPDPLEPHRA